MVHEEMITPGEKMNTRQRLLNREKKTVLKVMYMIIFTYL